MSIRAVVFDFGNVVAFFSPERAVEQLAAFAPPGTSRTEMVDFLFYTDLEPRFERGEVSSAEVMALVRRRFGLRGTDEELARAFADMFTPNEPVCRLIPLLRGRYRLALLSNTNELHYRHFREQFAGTLAHIDLLVTSHEVGFRKPDPRIYRLVEERLHAAPAECLFLDDLPANVEAARACGWRGIVYQKGADLPAKLRAHGVELPDVRLT
jgi:putative hydrolase of the HAD superfamily